LIDQVTKTGVAWYKGAFGWKVYQAHQEKKTLRLEDKGGVVVETIELGMCLVAAEEAERGKFLLLSSGFFGMVLIPPSNRNYHFRFERAEERDHWLALLALQAPKTVGVSTEPVIENERVVGATI